MIQSTLSKKKASLFQRPSKYKHLSSIGIFILEERKIIHNEYSNNEPIISIVLQVRADSAQQFRRHHKCDLSSDWLSSIGILDTRHRKWTTVFLSV